MNEKYSEGFFAEQGDGSLASANAIVPLILDFTGPVSSLIDVGGGLGGWAAVAKERGVENVTVIDGEWVPREKLKILPNEFRVEDLSEPLNTVEKYDLVFCLEVAEHFPESRAASLVEDLCRLADTVVFSAAIPGQGGTNHVNEKWLTYWVDLFKRHDFGLLDPIRPKLRFSLDVDVWYAQNLVIFKQNVDTDYTKIIDYVHPRLWEWSRSQI